ncbi:hypothetical protein GCM10010327_59170 [Streptomyces nitrosporeus]|nr:hypothetical protein GCM10010327_59170 [Streptomyces nitrosporeus]
MAAVGERLLRFAGLAADLPREKAAVTSFVVRRLITRSLLVDLSGNPEGTLHHLGQIAEVRVRGGPGRTRRQHPEVAPLLRPLSGTAVEAASPFQVGRAGWRMAVGGRFDMPSVPVRRPGRGSPGEGRFARQEARRALLAAVGGA